MIPWNAENCFELEFSVNVILLTNQTVCRCNGEVATANGVYGDIRIGECLTQDRTGEFWCYVDSERCAEEESTRFPGKFVSYSACNGHVYDPNNVRDITDYTVAAAPQARDSVSESD